MVWTEKSVVQQRLEFVHLAQGSGVSMAELCRRFGVSRKTGYKWLGRYQAEPSLAGLADIGRKPRNMPRLSGPQVEVQVIALRQAHPAWGGRKIAHVLQRDAGLLVAPSTVTSILHRHGLITPAASAAATAWNRFEHERPNSLWQMDFKGHFGMHQGRCHPLTIVDDHSRYNIELLACADEKANTVQPALKQVFRVYGMPHCINVDNGQPWGTSAGPYLTELGAWIVQLGISLSHSTPMHPQTNGKDERLHRTLNIELLAHNHFIDLSDCQRAFDKWRSMYNHYRPHEALGMKTPIERYAPSPIAFPEDLPPIEYSSQDMVRKVCNDGRISVRNHSFFISHGLRGKPVALRPSSTEDGVMDVYFCHQRIKSINLKSPDTAQ